MRPVLTWIDKITDGENNDQGCCVYDLAFKPDGSELLVAADVKVLIYDGTDGTLLQALKGHKGLVYTVAWSHDGQRFASGSADKSVIIWTDSHEGTLKYNHSDAIQCLSFNPVQCVLLSCAISDYALWSPNEKNVIKQKVSGRITCCTWSRTGGLFALGLFDGTLLVRVFEDVQKANSNADNAVKTERTGGDPIWAITFTHLTQEELIRRKIALDARREVLVVTSWDRSLAFWSTDGHIIEKLEEKKDDIRLDYDPTCVHYFNEYQFLVVGGSNKFAQLYTKFGTYLGIVAQMDTWVWYAFRENMTDVVVQYLPKGLEARIRCEDIVRRVAIFNRKVAVQLSNRIVIYDQVGGEGTTKSFQFELVSKIDQALDCSLLVVCEKHIILCQEKYLHCLDHRGVKQREWTLSSLIRYIKVIGGPAGRESILVGLKSGQVCKIFVDNPFPVNLFELSTAVRCLDISLDRRFIAIVDENNVAITYDLQTKRTVFQEPNCTSIAFHSDMEDIICYCGGGNLRIRAGNFEPFQMKMQYEGFVVGLTGNKVHCLRMYSMNMIEIPFTTQLHQYIEKKEFQKALLVACLGVTERDWRVLAVEALENLDLRVARKAYSHCKDFAALQLVSQVQKMLEGKEDPVLIRARILAQEKRFEQVAELYKQNGYDHEAMQLFTDLRMFEDAQALMSAASGETKKMLMRKRGDWAKNSNEPKLAANMFISSGDYEKALTLIIQNDWMDFEKELLLNIAEYLISKKEYGLATKIYNKLNEVKLLLDMHIAAEHWNDAFAIADRYPGMADVTYLEYGRWLAEQDRFEEAQNAFHRAGADKEAVLVLQSLAENAVAECRFLDAAYFHWMMSAQFAERLALFLLANIGRALGAFKLARTSLERLSKYHVPPKMQRLIEVATVKIRAEKVADDEQLLPMCPACSLTNSLDATESCSHCGNKFFYCFVSFEILPVAEFWVESEISSEEAISLILAEPPLSGEPFSPFKNLKRENRPMLGRRQLTDLQPSAVLISSAVGDLPRKFYFNVISSQSVSICSSCNHLFQTDELEMSRVREGRCPFCRFPTSSATGTQKND